ncbi:hypothetical protein V1515DRAFT_622099 [Lipomyces mesembrius]
MRTPPIQTMLTHLLFILPFVWFGQSSYRLNSRTKISDCLWSSHTRHVYSFGKSSLIDCFKTNGRQLYRILVGTTIQALQQLTGINFIFYYGTDFFQKSGISNPFTIALVTNIVNVAFTPPGMYAVEKLGRRNFLLLGAVGMCVCEYIVAIVGTSVNSVVSNKVLIGFVCCYIAFFASSWGPVAWVVVGESFSLRTRSKSVTICAESNWLWNFGIGYATPYMVDSGLGIIRNIRNSQIIE